MYTPCPRRMVKTHDHVIWAKGGSRVDHGSSVLNNGYHICCVKGFLKTRFDMKVSVQQGWNCCPQLIHYGTIECVHPPRKKLTLYLTHFLENSKCIRVKSYLRTDTLPTLMGMRNSTYSRMLKCRILTKGKKKISPFNYKSLRINQYSLARAKP